MKAASGSLISIALLLGLSSADAGAAGDSEHGQYLPRFALPLSGAEQGPTAQNYTLFESAPVRPLALSADGRRLYAVNTPAGQLDVFAVSDQGLVLIDSVAVGLEPVAVALNADETEAWVVNHLSDSISVLALSTKLEVKYELAVGDEPRDIVFAGPGRRQAFITTAHRGLAAGVDPLQTSSGQGRADVWVFQTSAEAAPQRKTILTLFGDLPRALASSVDGRWVYAAVFRSGNGTTTLAPNQFVKNPPTTSADGVAQPDTGLIVKRDAGGRWLDERGVDWSRRLSFDLPDFDLFRINAADDMPVVERSYSGLGTTLFNLAVNPQSGEIYISNTEARNQVRFAGRGLRDGTTVRGHLLDHRVSIIDADQRSRIVDLNPHLNFSTASPSGDKRLSLAQPMAMAVTADGSQLLIAGFGSQKVARVPTAELRTASYAPRSADQIALSAGGPGGIVIDERRSRAYVATRFDNGISVLDVNQAIELSHVQQYNPEPASVREGRRFLYDAELSSALGNESCASCHLFGDTDGLAWDLGNPDDVVKPSPNPYHPSVATAPGLNFNFHPMKGPMTTQSMRGLKRHGPMHWRGDRTGADRRVGESLERAAFKEFNEAFDGLMGREQPLDADQLERFADFALEIQYPPNPNRLLDNSLAPREARGKQLFDAGFARANAPTEFCASCHPIDFARGIFGTEGLMSFNLQPGEKDFKIPHFRDQYQKVGMFSATPGGFHVGAQVRGFGYNHNGATSSSAILAEFPLPSADLDAVRHYLLAWPTETATMVGQAVLLPETAATASLVSAEQLLQRARLSFPLPECDAVLLGKSSLGEPRGFLHQRSDDRFVPDRIAEPAQTWDQLRAMVEASGQAWQLRCLPWGNGRRAALDWDLDAVLNGDEIEQGSDPRNPLSTRFTPRPGLWWNPAVPGSGFDIHPAGDQFSLIWYRYDAEGQPTWYLAAAPAAQLWQAELRRFQWQDGAAISEVVGSIRVDFSNPQQAEFSWQLGESAGSERIEWFDFGGAALRPDATGLWADAEELGYGVSIGTQGDAVAALVYFYAADGAPRWALGSAVIDGASWQIGLNRYRLCGECPAPAALSESAGSIELQAFDRRLLMQLDVSAGDGAAWQRAGVELSPLTDPPYLRQR